MFLEAIKISYKVCDNMKNYLIKVMENLKLKMRKISCVIRLFHYIYVFCSPIILKTIFCWLLLLLMTCYIARNSCAYRNILYICCTFTTLKILNQILNSWRMSFAVYICIKCYSQQTLLSSERKKYCIFFLWFNIT